MTTIAEAQGWASAPEALVERIGPRFCRVEARQRALTYLRGLLAPLGFDMVKQRAGAVFAAIGWQRLSEVTAGYGRRRTRARSGMGLARLP